MELKIMTWNVKGGASLGWDDKKIQKKVVDKALEQEAHCMVLTEFIVTRGVDYLFERLQNKGYIWFQISRTGKNGILIAVKKNLLDYDEEDNKLKKQIWFNNIVSSEFEGCNLLRVTLPLKCGKNLSIIGCRMETGNNLQAQYNSARGHFDNILMPHIQPINQGDLYIVCGDFNNARCLGNLNIKFNPQDYNGKSQFNYNLNIIKDRFDDIGFTMADICGEGEAIPTHNGYFPDDHIFVYGLEVKICEVVPSDKLSDHSILIAECLFFKDKDYVIVGEYFKDGGETYTLEELLCQIENDLGYGKEEGKILVEKCVELGFITECGNNTYTR